MDSRPRGLPEDGVVLEDVLQEAGLPPAAGAGLLLGEDAAEESAEPLGVGEDGVQPRDEPQGEHLVRHNVAVDHHHLQGLDACFEQYFYCGAIFFVIKQFNAQGALRQRQ